MRHLYHSELDQSFLLNLKMACDLLDQNVRSSSASHIAQWPLFVSATESPIVVSMFSFFEKQRIPL
jgi:hypothetical protein